MDFGTQKPAGVQAPSEFTNAKLYVWVKGLESKMNTLMREVDILKNDLIKKNESLRKNMKTLNDDLMEMKHQQEKTVQKMDLIIKELKQTAGIEEVMAIKKYIEFWNPLHFVTQDDLAKALEAHQHEAVNKHIHHTHETTTHSHKKGKE